MFEMAPLMRWRASTRSVLGVCRCWSMLLLLVASATLAVAEEAELPAGEVPTLSAQPPAPDEAPSVEFMAQVYAVSDYGVRLYDEQRYAEARPHLAIGAQYGFKLAQAALGDIYLHGRGGVARDLAAGLGWLGVAAERPTLSRVEDFYQQVLDQLPDEQAAQARRLALRYRARYAASENGVACEVFGTVVEELRCRFVDDAEFESAMKSDPEVVYADGDYVEEMTVVAPIVTVPAPELGQMPSGDFIAQVYDAANRGTDLYRQKRYKEALPYLLVAARRGFKWAQASVGDIYLHGRGEVPADLEAGIGWLGVAAQQRTTNAITQFYKESRGKLPERFTDDAVEEIVSDYRSSYGNLAHRVACRFDVDEGRSFSLRLKSLRCHFIDEGTQCRDITIEDGPSGGEVASRWTCQPLSGTRSIDMRRN